METNIILRFERKYCECVQLGNAWLFVYALTGRKGLHTQKNRTACRAIRWPFKCYAAPRFPSSTAVTFDIGLFCLQSPRPPPITNSISAQQMVHLLHFSGIDLSAEFSF